MIKPLTLSHPDLSDNISTVIKTDYSPSLSLVVANTTGFAVDDYVVLGKPGLEQAEIVKINAIANLTTLTLSASGGFSHASDTSVTHIPYNQFRVYRSVTGVGGTYALLATVALQIDQIQNIYRDMASASPYSYKFCFYNSTTLVESSYSDEIAFGGYPAWSLKAMQDAILGDFGDRGEKFIERSDVTRWLNYFLFETEVYLMGGESPYYVDYEDVTSTGANNYDLDTYEILGIFMIELSTDGGVTWSDPITPKDFRFRDASGNITQYDYRIAGNTLLFTGQIVPAGNIMRIWYTTNPVPLANPTDVLPNPLRPMLGYFHDYGMMRANEKDRKPDLNYAYQSRIKEAKSDGGLLYKLRKRIRQGNMPVASTNADGFGGY